VFAEDSCLNAAQVGREQGEREPGIAVVQRVNVLPKPDVGGIM